MCPKRKLHLHISNEELARRLAEWKAPAPPMASGYWKLYIDHVLQADEGVDLDFLVGQRGSADITALLIAVTFLVA